MSHLPIISGLLGQWTLPSLASLTASDTELFNVAGGIRIPNVMATKGHFSGISLRCSGDIGAAGSLIVTVYKNGVATAGMVTLAATGGVDRAAVKLILPVIAFAAGDELTVFARRTSVLLAMTLNVCCWGALHEW